MAFRDLQQFFSLQTKLLTLYLFFLSRADSAPADCTESSQRAGEGQQGKEERQKAKDIMMCILQHSWH